MDWIYNKAGLVTGITIAIINIIGWIWAKFNKAYKIKKENEEFHETVENHSKQIDQMSLIHRDDYKGLNLKLDEISSTLSHFIEETKKDNQVILRDKIYEAYKLTLQKGYILEKDSKNYHYALERYLANGGNSYVSEEIEPRMKEFRVFNNDDDALAYFSKVS